MRTAAALLRSAISTSAVLVTVSATAFGDDVPPDPTPADIAWVARGAFCEPETVLPLPDDTLLVSNVCDFRAAGKGFLTLLDNEGQAIDWRIVDGLDSPLGMALADERLYVVDSNQLRVFRWPGYAPLRTFQLRTTVANDVAVAADGTAYVTDTARHQVIRLQPDGTQTVLLDEARFTGANGIALAGDQLYVGGERLWRVDLLTGGVSTIGPSWLADIDGIEIEADGGLQLTPVGGPLVRYRHDDEIEVQTGDGISSANHGYAPALRLVLIPTGFDNTVIAIRLAIDP